MQAYVDRDKKNVLGRAVMLGNPLGFSGATILVILLGPMTKKVLTDCVEGIGNSRGGSTSTVISRRILPRSNEIVE